MKYNFCKLHFDVNSQRLQSAILWRIFIPLNYFSMWCNYIFKNRATLLMIGVLGILQIHKNYQMLSRS